MTDTRKSHDHGAVCLCMADHRPAPLEYAAHRLLPGQYGGTYAPENVVWLCPTTHVNVHELMRLFFARNGDFTWKMATDLYMVPVSRYAFSVARLGWLKAKEARSAGPR